VYRFIADWTRRHQLVAFFGAAYLITAVAFGMDVAATPA
jgi:hypothetical protein